MLQRISVYIYQFASISVEQIPRNGITGMKVVPILIDIVKVALNHDFYNPFNWTYKISNYA